MDRAYSIKDPLYDLGTFPGRLCYFFSVLNPFNCLYTASQVKQMEDKIKAQAHKEELHF
eukprot:NODE_1706_length_1088_cov_83.521655_g1391_i0.p1 GENE.NODE_1706_length_1088_cov_83.521655_g1391_i0~~NODE_1706_length_1088_cov_83.521655_g1391_i0.p1  ORF type:complete len:59 (-),score=11.30 NODE_1706_length_1088_cov_83.521655_g1391_i0:877-1053(-)